MPRTWQRVILIQPAREPVSAARAGPNPGVRSAATQLGFMKARDSRREEADKARSVNFF
jgi:hypothetical protein